jgi:hypothetical protein
MMPKKILRFLSLATLLCPALSAMSAHAAEPAPAIRIDGHLDDAAWQKARPLDAFKTVEFKMLRGVTPAGQKPQAQTTGMLFTDANTLYLGFRCEEPLMEKLEERKLPRDGSVWTNDCIEVFIAPFQRTDEYFQITVDVAGQIFDTFKSGGTLDTAYDISVIAKTQKQQDGWTMEMAIPLSEAGLSQARDALINFGRERKPVNELSSWHGDFGKPGTWRKVPLALDKHYDVDVRDWSFGALQYGENELALEYVASGAAPLGVLLQAQENGKWQNKVRITAQSTPVPNRRVTLPYVLSPQHKPQSLRLTLERGGTPVFRVTRRLVLPAEALIATLAVPYYYADENFGFVRLENFVSPAALQKSRLRLTVKNPAGQVVASREIQDLRPLTRAGFDISGWRSGDGSLIAELISDGQTLSSRTVIIEKRPGPFSARSGG